MDKDIQKKRYNNQIAHIYYKISQKMFDECGSFLIHNVFVQQECGKECQNPTHKGRSNVPHTPLKQDGIQTNIDNCRCAPAENIENKFRRMFG
ncbi:MAG: hypothetical protein PHU04_04865 [Candidatus Peribacteraceae bacterium]|nr:hypothetical protein [Candidatus Peribacteraceae bacterium]